MPKKSSRASVVRRYRALIPGLMEAIHCIEPSPEAVVGATGELSVRLLERAGVVNHLRNRIATIEMRIKKINKQGQGDA